MTLLIEAVSQGATSGKEIRDSRPTAREVIATGLDQARHTATNSVSAFEDDFTMATSGGPSGTGGRFYRISYSSP